MKYTLVALFDNESNKLIEVTQKSLCKKYKLYKTSQQFYIPIQSIIDPELEKFNKIVLDAISPYKKFKVQINPNFYLDKSQKTINLRVENRGYITRIARNITDTLSLSGFNVNVDKCQDLFISIANSNYTLRKTLSAEAPNALTSKDEDVSFDFGKINRLELWKSVNNKREVLVKDYPLREY